MNSSKPPPPTPSVPPPGERRSIPPDGRERRTSLRVDVTWAVDCNDGETFLYAYITNISALGIFIATRTPPALGAPVNLRFAPPQEEPLELRGEVAWINAWREDGENLNPGFGVRFTELSPEHRERLVALVHAIAYLPG